jgi:glycosyltransferase involved in cell wall biosynthesis
MVRVVIVVVTYRNEQLLERCLDSIIRADDVQDVERKIIVLNNYDRLSLSTCLEPHVRVINNEGRPDFSTGHLARSWNQGIMHSIHDINNPDCDVLILAQNDAEFKPTYLSAILDLVGPERSYDYMTVGVGDEVQVMTPASIKAIGLYDERFCNIGYQEMDYMSRAKFVMGSRVSINDHGHGRTHNPVDANTIEKIIVRNIHGHARNDEYHCISLKYHTISYELLKHKWNNNVNPFNLPEPQTVPKQYMLYPYFEKALPNLEQKYIVF